MSFTLVLTTDVPLIVPQDPISFDKFLVPRGLQPGEIPIPESSESGSSLADTAATLPPLNETAFNGLQEMGFPANRVEKALRMTGNADMNAAMQWLFDHMDDADIDAPFVAPAAGQEIPVDAEKKMNLMGMGFEERMAEKALRETVITPFLPPQCRSILYSTSSPFPFHYYDASPYLIYSHG